MFLPDVNVLIALAWDDHIHHSRVHAWFKQIAGQAFSTCNITQSGFVRLCLNPKVVHCEMSIAEVFKKLESFTKHPSHSFCEDGPLQTDLPAWQGVSGHAHVTDTNLFSIARRHGRKFVTLDGGIISRLQGDNKAWVELIP